MAKKKTFADEAKTIMNKYKTRLGEKFDKGDTLALEAMNQELNGLREKQEETRMTKLIDEGVLEENNQFACGGKLMKHQEGGMLPMMEMEDGSYAYGGGLPEYQNGGEFDLEETVEEEMPLEPWMSDPTHEVWRGAGPTNEAGFAVAPEYGSIPDTGSNKYKNVSTEQQPYTTRVPWWGAAAQGVGAMLMNRNIDFGETGRVTPQQVVPRTVDYSRSREQIMRERDIANAMIRRGAKIGGSKSGYIQNVIGGATATGRTAGRQFTKSLEGEANVNAQIRNRAQEFNAQQRAMSNRLNAQRQRENLMINEQRRAGRIGGVMGAVTGYGKDLTASSQYDQMLRMMEPENFKLMSKEQRGWLLRMLGVSDVAELKFKRGKATIGGKS